MVDVAFAAGRVLAAFFLVFLNGFFVASEFAFVRVRSSAVETLAQEGRAGAATLQEAMANLDDYLAVTQLGITISSLGLGWIGEPAVAALLEPVLAPVLPTGAIHLAAFVVGFSVITFLHVVFGELAPKTIAIARAEQIALSVARPMKGFYFLFIPGIVVFNGTANFFTRLIGIPPASETEETLTEEEILTVLTRSGTEGHIDVEEVEMIERVFELDDITVREIMVPGPDVVGAPADLALDELRSLILEAGHTRYPVLDDEQGGEVAGFVDVKDVLRASAGRQADDQEVTAGDLMRPITVVPETGRVTDLLSQLQRDERQMAAVIDEWGAFEGIATVEDVVEVVVGDLRDQFDVPDREPTIERLDDGTYLVDGQVALMAVNDTLGSEFESDHVETIGGLVLDTLGRVPEVGDRVEIDPYVVEVDRMDGARISTVIISEAGPDGEGDHPAT